MADSRPNILFIMTDDHAANAISCYGSKVNKTPNLDRIAEEGAKLDHCYVTNSICTPSRAAILTGTHNHVNGVTTLRTHINNRLPNIAKHLKTGGYQTCMIGKWHLGEKAGSWPTGFDFWSILPDQGAYFNPPMWEMEERIVEKGYTTDIIADKCLKWLDERDPDKPFFMMCHHKAPHRTWIPKEEHRDLYTDEIPYPETFDDDYSNRAKAAIEATMRISEDFNYIDLDLVGPAESQRPSHETVPFPEEKDIKDLVLICALTGENFTFSSREELKKFKYQRYMRKYLQTVHAVDENVGRMLDYLDEKGLAENTVVIYTSDQGFYLGEHGWFDKRFIYEESFQMPFMIRYPKEIPAGSVNTDMISNVDFASLWTDYANLPRPNYMQGRTFRENLKGNTPDDWTDLAYHRYWMNQDEDHNAYAHYGIRTHKYKLIYWYNDDLGLEGCDKPDYEEKDWELFDLEKDPLELFNCYDDPAYADVVKEMRLKLEKHMIEIGDTPEHELLLELA